MDKELTEIKVHLAEIKVDLRHHMKRTELLEDEVRAWREDLKPVQRHVNVVRGLGTVLMIVAAVAGSIGTVLAVL